MPELRSFDGTTIAYTDDGDGAPVVLLHGFAADTEANWRACGVLDALLAAGRRVIGVDARGHGRSGKPHDPAAYGNNAMVHDVRAVFDHLDLASADVVGYSMGSLTTSRFAPGEARVRSIVLGGVGAGIDLPRRVETSNVIADALEADDPSTITDPTGKGFRRFADSTGADRHALAALQRAPWREDAVDLATITVPTLVLTGDRDELVGSPHALAAKIPGARAEVISGDHLGAVMDPRFPKAIVAFLDEVDAGTATA